MKKFMGISAVFMAALTALLVSACGGGGGGSLTPTPTPTPVPVAAPTATLLSITPASGAVDVIAGTSVVLQLSVSNASAAQADLAWVCSGRTIPNTPMSSTIAADGKVTLTLIPATSAEQGGDVCTLSGSVKMTGSGGTMKTSIQTSFTIVAARIPVCTPPQTWVAGVKACVYPMGVWVVGANQLPVGCNTWKDQCWADSVANGTVKWIATSTIMTGYNSRPVVFAFFRNTSTAFGVTGLWDTSVFYADDGSSFSDISGGVTVESDRVYTTDKGIVQHDKATGLCYLLAWDAKDKSWDTWYVSGGSTVPCPPFSQ